MIARRGRPRAAQDFHFGKVGLAQGTGAIDDVDDAGAFFNRFEELAFVLISRKGAVLFPKGVDGLLICRAEVFQPGQGMARVLKARRIGKFDDNPAIDNDRIIVTGSGFAGHRANRYGVVLSQGRNHGGFALVGMADNSETQGCRVTHAGMLLFGERRCRDWDHPGPGAALPKPGGQFCRG